MQLLKPRNFGWARESDLFPSGAVPAGLAQVWPTVNLNLLVPQITLNCSMSAVFRRKNAHDDKAGTQCNGATSRGYQRATL